MTVERLSDVTDFILEYLRDDYTPLKNPTDLMEDICKAYVNVSEAEVNYSLWYLVAADKIKISYPSLKVGLYV